MRPIYVFFSLSALFLLAYSQVGTNADFRERYDLRPYSQVFGLREAKKFPSAPDIRLISVNGYTVFGRMPSEYNFLALDSSVYLTFKFYNHGGLQKITARREFVQSLDLSQDDGLQAKIFVSRPAEAVALQLILESDSAGIKRRIAFAFPDEILAKKTVITAKHFELKSEKDWLLNEVQNTLLRNPPAPATLFYAAFQKEEHGASFFWNKVTAFEIQVSSTVPASGNFNFQSVGTYR